MMVMDYGNVGKGNIHWTFVGFIGGQDDTVFLWTFMQITFSGSLGCFLDGGSAADLSVR